MQKRFLNLYSICIVGNKAKKGISKRVFQENKVRQIFRKNKHFLPPDTHTYVLRFTLFPYYQRHILWKRQKTKRFGRSQGT